MDGINVYALFNPNAVLNESQIAKLMGIPQQRMSDLLTSGQFQKPWKERQGRKHPDHRWRVGDINMIVRL
jgi:hypothetical protein